MKYPLYLKVNQIFVIIIQKGFIRGLKISTYNTRGKNRCFSRIKIVYKL